MKKIIYAAVGLALSAMPIASSAATVEGVCITGSIRTTVGYVTANDGNYVACSSGNINYSNKDAEGNIVTSLFGMDYFLSYKSDEAGKGDGLVTFNDVPTDNDASDNTWSFKTPISALVESIVLVFKQSSGYAAFLVEGTSGTWDIARLQAGKGPLAGTFVTNNDYSHVDIWYKKGDGDTDGDGGKVPLPAAAWFLLTGVAGFGAMRRFRKA